MKVFGIGLSKTGTTSLAKALEILGYSTKDCLGVNSYSSGDLSSIDQQVLDSYDALTDTPIPSFYRELYQKYPDAKFILTVRDMDGWLKSCRKQFTAKLAAKQTDAHNKLFEDLYGTAIFEEDSFRSGYERFAKLALEFFENKPDSLLVMDVIKGDGWEALCPFLGKEVPVVPFPKANVTSIRWMNIESLVSVTHFSARKAQFLNGTRFYDGCKVNHDVGFLVKIDDLLFYFQYFFIKKVDNERSDKFFIKKIYLDIVSSLNRLYPDIPVISALNCDDFPYESRCKYSHFWLVDVCTSYSSEGLSSIDSINIALIEDRMPVVGIVHDLSCHKTYYALAWKGAFIHESGKTRQLESRGKRLDLVAHIEHEKDSTGNALGKYDHFLTKNVSLELCKLVDELESAKHFEAGSFEWQTAAGHAVINAVGLSLRVSESGINLQYNKDDWKNERIEVTPIF